MARRNTISRTLVVAALAVVLWPTSAWAVALTNPLKAVSFSDASNGYIAGGVSDGVVSWTKDGGQSWHAEIVSARPMAGVCASLDGGTATAVSSFYDGAYGASNTGAAGSWETPLLSLSVDYADVAYLAGGRRAVVGKLTPSNEIGLITSSVGSTWAIDFQGPVYPPPDDITPAPTTHAVFTGIDAAPGGNVTWAVGIDWTESGPTGPYKAMIYKTANAGSTWTTQTASSGENITCVAAVDTQTAFIGRGNRVVLRTLDGSTWGGIQPSSTWGITVVNGIDALDANHVLAVGDGGKIFWSSNAATATPTWSRPPVAPTTNTLLGAQMLDANNWVVVGDNETILRTSDAGATWTGVTAPNAPTIAITSPTSEHLLDSATIAIEGTSTDGRGIGVAGVEVRIEKSGPQYWNGSSWVGSETWLQASNSDATDGWDTWEKTVSIPDTTSVGTLTVWARATDGLGLKSSTYAFVTSTGGSPLLATTITPAKTSQTIAFGGTATIAGTLKSGSTPLSGKTVTLSPGGKTALTDSSGKFTFSVTPNVKTTYTLGFPGGGEYLAAASKQVVVTPYAKVTTPVVPSYVRHTRSFKAYCYLYPKHTTGNTVVTFYFQRKNIRGKWITEKTITAKAAADASWRSKCTSPYVKLKTGKWRVRAKHADSGHATTYSAQKYFTSH